MTPGKGAGDPGHCLRYHDLVRHLRVPAMARHIADRDLSPLLSAAAAWIQHCLVEDGSLFVPQRALWTAEQAQRLQIGVVGRPELRAVDFFSGLQRQLADVGAPAQQLMAEMLWALLLFPSNIGVEAKRTLVRRVWALSGEQLDGDHSLLQGEVLRGVGSGGTAYHTGRPRELAYLVALVQSLKALPPARRREVFADYDRFMDWIDSVPREGDRQFRHMLRYLAFPDRVERMSSNRDRHAILEGFEVAPRSQTRHWSDQQLDEALLALRQREEALHPGQVLDFYEPALEARWRGAGATDADDSGPVSVSVANPARPRADDTAPPGPTAVNLIVYGPPGTGKTHWLRRKIAEYGEGPGGRPRHRIVTFHPSTTYEDFVRGIRPVEDRHGSGVQFRVVDGVFKQLCDQAIADPGHRHALFIDEINRAHIAKVFGELITLIEPDKRAVFDAQGRLVEGVAVQLAGSGSDEPPFGVPPNLDIYGTMNTADRSIALLDIALRRRFRFLEMPPDLDLLAQAAPVEGVDLARLLRRINDRLEFLLDRDHLVGHAYLLPVRTLQDLRQVFAHQLLPLLQEYFFDDIARVALVMSTTGAPVFVREQALSAHDLFSGRLSERLPAERLRQVFTPPSSWTALSFRGLYEDVRDESSDPA